VVVVVVVVEDEEKKPLFGRWDGMLGIECEV